LHQNLNNMKNIKMFISGTLAAVFACIALTGCGEGENSVVVPTYSIAKITSVEADEAITFLTYGDRGLSEFTFNRNGDYAGKATVQYLPTGLTCAIDGIQYDIQYGNTHGTFRAEEITAKKDGVMTYRVDYTYDEEGRIKMAAINGISSVVIYTEYAYENNKIKIDDYGHKYELDLSSEENTGNVCNVFGFVETPTNYTTQYVINPTLYYLNIYGVPVSKLPVNQDVEREGSRLVKVGKYRYTY